MSWGKFISIEGTEGAGKSTALDYIANYLTEAGLKVVLTREPGGTSVSEEIRKLLLHSQSETIPPITELLLMFASRAQHLEHCIVPALTQGTWVVSDRYVDASYAYQGGGRGISAQDIQCLDKLVVGNWYPDLTLLLDIPADLGMRRTEKRGIEKDRIEQERMDFFERVRRVYLNRATENPQRIKIIDASQPVSAVQDQIHRVLDHFMRIK
jgi:dTMP kinase